MDYMLILVVAALLILGLMMVYSATFDMAFLYEDGNSTYYFTRQLVWTALGLAGMVALALIDYRVWERYAVPILAVTLALMAVVVVWGKAVNGAPRWIRNGSIQPSELAKIAMAIYIAAWVTSKGDKIRQVSYGLIPFAILIALVTGLVLMQNDMHTAVLLVITAWLMFFIAGADIVQLLATVVLGLPVFALSILNTPHRQQRFDSWLNLGLDPNGVSFQVRQALVALASGGILGKGIGEGNQKFSVVPAIHTDSIMAILGEELGLIGCLVLIGLFVLFAYRGFKIALEASDDFGTILASGLTCAVSLQALLNMAVVTATVPTAGVPLPFISYGGSSMVTTLACVGLLLSISRGSRGTAARRPKKRGTGARTHLGRGNWRPRVSSARHR
jgi:cell division protein FtsW